MRWSDWRGRAPSKVSITPKVLAVVESALVALGVERDPECWVAWGDDPAVRYLIIAPTASGLAQVNVRVNVPGEGPRASGKIVRWGRVQFGDLGVEIQGGHRLVTFQVESQVLNGVNEVADGIARFAQVLFAAVDGRPTPPAASPVRSTTKRRAVARPGAAAAAPSTSAARAVARPARSRTPK